MTNENLWFKSDDAYPEIITDQEGNFVEYCYDQSPFDRVDSDEHTKSELILTEEDYQMLAEIEKQWEDEMAGFYAIQSDKYDKDVEHIMTLKSY